MRRSELIALDVEHITWMDDGMKLLIAYRYGVPDEEIMGTRVTGA